MDISFTTVNRTNGSNRRLNSGLIWNYSHFSISSKNRAFSRALIEGDTHSVVNGDNVSRLCKNCEFPDNCTWYRKDAEIFHCDHYQ